MNTPETIYVAGHRGMVGSAIVRQLHAAGHPASAIVTVKVIRPSTGVQYSERQFIEMASKGLGITLVFVGTGVDEKTVVKIVGGVKAPAVKPDDVIVQVNPKVTKTIACDPGEAKRHALLKTHGYDISLGLEN